MSDRISLTLVVLPSGNVFHNPIRTVASLEMNNHMITIYAAHGTDPSTIQSPTPWILFLYSDEIVSKGLREVLPTYLGQTNYDFYSIFRANRQERLDIDHLKLSICPRLFRDYVKLAENSLMPQEGPQYKFTNILDGFIIGAS